MLRGPRGGVRLPWWVGVRGAGRQWGGDILLWIFWTLSEPSPEPLMKQVLASRSLLVVVAWDTEEL